MSFGDMAGELQRASGEGRFFALRKTQLLPHEVFQQKFGVFILSGSYIDPEDYELSLGTSSDGYNFDTCNHFVDSWSTWEHGSCLATPTRSFCRTPTSQLQLPILLGWQDHLPEAFPRSSRQTSVAWSGRYSSRSPPGAPTMAGAASEPLSTSSLGASFRVWMWVGPKREGWWCWCCH